MEVIILAAGMGTRLGAMTADRPKALVKVGNRALIEYALDAALANGATNIIVVGGSGYDLLSRFVNAAEKYAGQPIVLVENKDFRLGNLYSLRGALSLVQDDFFLTNVDHVFCGALWKRLFSLAPGLTDLTLFSDNQKPVLDDQMKIFALGNKVAKISKSLVDFNHGYIGIDYCPRAVVDKFKRVAMVVDGEQAAKENVFNDLIKKGTAVSVLDIGGENWFEVDTPADWNAAEQLVRQNENSWI